MTIAIRQDNEIRSIPTGSEKTATGPSRVVHVVSSLNVGGMEHFVLRMAAAQQGNHKVAVVALRGGPLTEEALKLGIDVHILGSKSKHLRVLRAALLFARLRPDIVHAHNQTSLHYAILAKKITGPRVVMTNHGQGLGSARTPSRSEWAATDAIVAVSQAVAQRMSDCAARDKVSVILNGIRVVAPKKSRDEVRAQLNIACDRSAGLIVARIDGLKGHDCLLQAVALLKNNGTLITILIAGDGAKRDEMIRLAADLGLAGDNVKFLGFRQDVPDLLQAVDFFVLPSLTEGLPLSVLEAMSHGVPVIATRVGGIPELVQDGNDGVLVSPGDSNSLAEAMSRIAKDTSLRCALGAAARARVENEFSFSEMVRNYDHLYRAVCTS